MLDDEISSIFCKAAVGAASGTSIIGAGTGAVTGPVTGAAADIGADVACRLAMGAAVADCSFSAASAATKASVFGEGRDVTASSLTEERGTGEEGS